MRCNSLFVEQAWIIFSGHGCHEIVYRGDRDQVPGSNVSAESTGGYVSSRSDRAVRFLRSSGATKITNLPLHRMPRRTFEDAYMLIMNWADRAV